MPEKLTGCACDSFEKDEGRQCYLAANSEAWLGAFFAKSESQDDIDRRGKHSLAGRVVEGVRVVEGMIDAQLGTNGQTSEWFRDRQLEIETAGEGAVSSPATANGARIDGRLTFERAQGIIRIGTTIRG